VGGHQRRSTEARRDVLRDLRDRGLVLPRRRTVGDGALGLWKAFAQVYPDIVHPHCWVHKTAYVLSALPTSLQAKAKGDLQPIGRAPTECEAQRTLRPLSHALRGQVPEGHRAADLATARR